MEILQSAGARFHDVLLPTLITDEHQRQRINYFRASIAGSVGGPLEGDTTPRSTSLNASLRSAGALNQSRVRAVSVPRASQAPQEVNNTILNKISLETSIDSDSEASSLFLLRSFADEVQSALRQVEEQRRAYSAAVDQLKAQLAESERCRSEAEYRVVALEQQAIDKFAQYTEMHAKSSLHHRIETGLRTAIQGLESQQAESLKKVTDMEREKGSLDSRLAESISRCSHLNTRLQEEQRTKLELQTHFQQLETEIARLMAETDCLRRNCASEHDAAEAAARTAVGMQAALRDGEIATKLQQSQLLALQSELATQQSLALEYQLQAEKYQKENENLRAQLQSQTAAQLAQESERKPSGPVADESVPGASVEARDPPVGESLGKLTAAMDFIMSHVGVAMASTTANKLGSKSVHIHLTNKRRVRWNRARITRRAAASAAASQLAAVTTEIPDITSTSFAVSENSDDLTGTDRRLGRSEVRSPFIFSSANEKTATAIKYTSATTRPSKASDASAPAPTRDHSPVLSQRAQQIYMSPPSVSSIRAGFAVSPDVEGNVLQTLSSLRELLGMCEKIP